MGALQTAYRCHCDVNRQSPIWSTDLPDHCMNCMNYTGMRNLRHGAVVNILYDYFRKLLPLGSVEREKSVGGGLQMDLVIKYGMNIFYVDVGIASITSKDALAKGASNIFGTASRLMEEAKIIRFKQSRIIDAAKFVPFIFETTGTVGNLADMFLKGLLAKLKSDRSQLQYLNVLDWTSKMWKASRMCISLHNAWILANWSQNSLQQLDPIRHVNGILLREDVASDGEVVPASHALDDQRMTQTTTIQGSQEISTQATVQQMPLATHEVSSSEDSSSHLHHLTGHYWKVMTPPISTLSLPTLNSQGSQTQPQEPVLALAPTAASAPSPAGE